MAERLSYETQAVLDAAERAISSSRALADQCRPTLFAIFPPYEHDRERLVRARKLIEFARKVLAESDPPLCWQSARPEHAWSAE